MKEIRPVSDLRNSIAELYRKLAEAESESANPMTRKKTHQEVMNRLRGRINEYRN
ncbi:hypothetical protein [Sporosarcina sp. FSL K6-2383]|uniref:hypothetical protein n=1 Tax=Sporosarcina sp. FSL K6-2383 TaxID=2921556 RepID=UPI00315B3104